MNDIDDNSMTFDNIYYSLNNMVESNTYSITNILLTGRSIDRNSHLLIQLDSKSIPIYTLDAECRRNPYRGGI